MWEVVCSSESFPFGVSFSQDIWKCTKAALANAMSGRVGSLLSLGAQEPQGLDVPHNEPPGSKCTEMTSILPERQRQP